MTWSLIRQMKIRFKQLVESQVPGFPFRPRQVIDVETPTPELLAMLDDGRAEAVRDDADGVEVAVVSHGDAVAAVVRPRGRRR